MAHSDASTGFLVTAASWQSLGLTCLINGSTFVVSDILAQCVERHWAAKTNRKLRTDALQHGKRADGSDCAAIVADWRAGLAVTQGKDADTAGGAERTDPAYPSNPEVVLSQLTPTELAALDDIIGHQVSDPGESSHNRPGISPKESRPFSIMRCTRFGLVGGTWGGVTTFFRFSVIAMVFPGSGYKVALGKMAINQFVFSPVLHGGVLLLNEWGKTGSFVRGWDKLCVSLLEVQLVTWATKVPLNFICFSFMPSVPLQALFMRTYDIFFYIYISMVADREDHPEVDDEGKDSLEDMVPEDWVEEPFEPPKGPDGDLPTSPLMWRNERERMKAEKEGRWTCQQCTLM
eukprot:TRINITY_DN9674_c0_g1_i1.p2 TRINITY_DN9674_c0_g1~~TRINITY_DN9674_c0_g1_i1.p2  ORF type:complete len:347 (+),score=127.35 TRINITY_DN9674_c0_g1_i1:117-1157(+)